MMYHKLCCILGIISCIILFVILCKDMYRLTKEIDEWEEYLRSLES